MKQYKKLPTHIQLLAEEKEVIFRANPYDSRLKTHKLSGKLFGSYVFSLNNNYRIIFNFSDKNAVRFFQVGNHDIYE